MALSCAREASTARVRRLTSQSTASGGTSRRNTGTASRSTTSAGPTARPGETPIPSSFTPPPRSRRPPARPGLHRGSLVLPVRAHREACALGGGEEEDAQDRLAVHAAAVV